MRKLLDPYIAEISKQEGGLAWRLWDVFRSEVSEQKKHPMNRRDTVVLASITLLMWTIIAVAAQRLFFSPDWQMPQEAPSIHCPTSSATTVDASVSENETFTVHTECDLKTAISDGWDKQFEWSNGYVWASEYLTQANFPDADCEYDQELEVTLVTLGADATTEQVLAELGNLGFRPATLRELLALWTQHNLQATSALVALGSGWRRSDGYVYFPILNVTDNGESVINVGRGVCGEKWNVISDFAAVRK